MQAGETKIEQQEDPSQSESSEWGNMSKNTVCKEVNKAVIIIIKIKIFLPHVTSVNFGYRSRLARLVFLALNDFQIIWFPDLLIHECTWCRLFQKLVVSTKFDIYVFITKF